MLSAFLSSPPPFPRVSHSFSEMLSSRDPSVTVLDLDSCRWFSLSFLFSITISPHLLLVLQKPPHRSPFPYHRHCQGTPPLGADPRLPLCHGPSPPFLLVQCLIPIRPSEAQSLSGTTKLPHLPRIQDKSNQGTDKSPGIDPKKHLKWFNSGCLGPSTKHQWIANTMCLLQKSKPYRSRPWDTQFSRSTGEGLQR